MGLGHCQSNRVQSNLSGASFAGESSSYSRKRFWNTVLGPSLITESESDDGESTEGGEEPKTSSGLVKHNVKIRSTLACPFICNEGCIQQFTQRSHLNQHVRTVHEQQRPHKCNQCDRAFGKRSDLASHESAVHKKERPHVCKVCLRSFAKRGNLVRHEGKLHKET